MVLPRLATPPSVSVHDFSDDHHHHKPFVNVSPIASSDPASHVSRRTSIAIPTKQTSSLGSVPPPLPPPRFINDLENGYDAGWVHANIINSQPPTKLPRIDPGSSLLGGQDHADPIESSSPDNHARVDQPPSSPYFSVDEGRPRSSLSVSTNLM